MTRPIGDRPGFGNAVIVPGEQGERLVREYQKGRRNGRGFDLTVTYAGGPEHTFPVLFVRRLPHGRGVRVTFRADRPAPSG